MSSSVILNNGGSLATPSSIGARIPPNAPLDFGSLATLFTSMTPRSTPPDQAVENHVYLDDGANTSSGTLGFRRYNGSVWEDFGLQEGAVSSTPTTGQHQVTDIRLDADLTLIVEYEDVPVV